MPPKAGAGLSKDVVGPVGVGVDLAPPSLPLGVESVLGSPLADRDPLAGASVALRPCGLGSARGRRGLRPGRVPSHLGSTLSLLFLNLGLGLLGGPGLLLLLGLFGGRGSPLLLGRGIAGEGRLVGGRLGLGGPWGLRRLGGLCGLRLGGNAGMGFEGLAGGEARLAGIRLLDLDKHDAEGGQLVAERVSQGVADGVDLGVQASARDSNRLRTFFLGAPELA